MGNSCACPPGYYGDRCQFKDTCLDKKCGNNGTLSDCNCNCQPTFYGNNCELSKVSGKQYKVENFVVHKAGIYLRCTKNSSTIYSEHFAVNGDIINCSHLYDKGKVYLTFSGSRNDYWFIAETGSVLRDCDNHVSHDYCTDYFTANVENNGDSVHVEVRRNDYLYRIEEDVLEFDFIRQ